MRQQVGRSHLVHGLLVQIPSAGVGELLGFEQDVLRLGGEGEGRKERGEDRGDLAESQKSKRPG